VLLAVAMFPVYPMADVGGGHHTANLEQVIKDVKDIWDKFIFNTLPL